MKNIDYLCRALLHDLVVVVRNEEFWAAVVLGDRTSDVSDMIQSKFAISQLPAFIDDFPFFPLGRGTTLAEALADLDAKIGILFTFSEPDNFNSSPTAKAKYKVDDSNLYDDASSLWSNSLIELARYYKKDDTMFFYSDSEFKVSDAPHLLALKTVSF